MVQNFLVTGMEKKDMQDFSKQNALSSKLTLEDFKTFLNNCGIPISDINICELDYHMPAVVFNLNSQKYILLYSDTRIAIQDIWLSENDCEINYADLDINLLALLLQDSWLAFMYEKFGYEYLLSYPTIGKKALKKRNYINLISDFEFKDFIINLLAKHQGKANCFYNIKKEEVIIQELESFYNSERRFLITRISDGTFAYIKFSDFAIVYPQFVGTSFFTFMVKRFGNSYLQNFREYALNKLHEEDVPKFIERQTHRIDEFIAQFSKESP